MKKIAAHAQAKGPVEMNHLRLATEEEISELNGALDLRGLSGLDWEQAILRIVGELVLGDCVTIVTDQDVTAPVCPHLASPLRIQPLGRNCHGWVTQIERLPPAGRSSSK